MTRFDMCMTISGLAMLNFGDAWPKRFCLLNVCSQGGKLVLSLTFSIPNIDTDHSVTARFISDLLMNLKANKNSDLLESLEANQNESRP